MKPSAAGPLLAGLLFCAAGVPAAAPAPGAPRLPRIQGEEAVASVNGEPVTVTEMMTRLGSMHEGLEMAQSAPERPDPMVVLERMIDARLVVQEARRIGLDRLPEITERLQGIRLGLLKSGLVRTQTRAVPPPDPQEVDRLYRAAVREVSLAMVLFGSEEAARKFLDAGQSCADFDDLAAEALASGEALRSQAPEFLKAAELRPEVAQAGAGLQVDGVSAPFQLQDGWAVVRLAGERFPEDPAARLRAEEQALQARQEVRIAEYTDELRTRYARLRKEVLSALDYEAPDPGMDALRRDRRVVADVKGGKPVTVAELTRRVEQKFYHGIREAIDRKRVNAEVPGVLDRLVVERAVEVEAKRLGIESTVAFKAGWKERTDSLLFEAFVRKVVNPDVKMTDAELHDYYDKHQSAFTTPAMLRLESLAFVKQEDARAAIERLRKGADLKWMKTHERGQATAERFPGLLEMNGGLLAVDALPAGMREALAGAGDGDVRFHAAPSGPFYVLVVRQAVSPAPQPYDSVRELVSVKVYEAKRKALIDDWVSKLRAGSEITIYAREADLKRILGLQAAGT